MHVRASRALRSIVSCSAYRGPFGSGPVAPRPELGSSCLLHRCLLRVQLDLSCLVLRIRDLPALARDSQDSNMGSSCTLCAGFYHPGSALLGRAAAGSDRFSPQRHSNPWHRVTHNGTPQKGGGRVGSRWLPGASGRPPEAPGGPPTTPPRDLMRGVQSVFACWCGTSCGVNP